MYIALSDQYFSQDSISNRTCNWSTVSWLYSALINSYLHLKDTLRNNFLSTFATSCYRWKKQCFIQIDRGQKNKILLIANEMWDGRIYDNSEEYFEEIKKIFIVNNIKILQLLTCQCKINFLYWEYHWFYFFFFNYSQKSEL